MDEMGRPELVASISENTNLAKRYVNAVLDDKWFSIANLLQKAEAEEDGSKRVEVHGGVIARLHKVEAMEHHGVAEGVIEPEHYRLDLKLEKMALDQMTGVLGLEVKNG